MAQDKFDISWGRHLLTTFVEYTESMWRWLGDLETKVLADELEGVDVEAPIYISGLARCGSTILLRVVESHPEIVSHQYRDFPFLYIPYWWQETQQRQVRGELEPAERAHEDRLKVTRRSPEAMEEVLWMAHFSGLHDPSSSNVLDAETDNEDFESFYRDHIRKLLVAREGNRYAAKANYNLTRLEYLLELFPDARFVVPVRRPVAHIASSMKQHRLFCEEIEEGDRAIRHLKRVGHYEFGPHRQPINAGDDEMIRSIQKLWAEGENVRGWARYWAHLYQFVADHLEADDALDEAIHLIRYEELCDHTRSALIEMLEHCRLGDRADHLAEQFESTISRPDYYDHDFSEEDLAVIAEETDDVARRFGYERDEFAAVAAAG